MDWRGVWERGVKEDSKVFVLRTWKDGVAIKRKTGGRGETSLGWRSGGVSVLDLWRFIRTWRGFVRGGKICMWWMVFKTMSPDQNSKRVSVDGKEVQTLKPGRLQCKFQKMRKTHGWNVKVFPKRRFGSFQLYILPGSSSYVVKEWDFVLCLMFDL